MDKPLIEPPKPAELKCRQCGRLPKQAQTLLDSTSGRTVRLYRCRCGEQSWEEQ